MTDARRGLTAGGAKLAAVIAAYPFRGIIAAQL